MEAALLMFDVVGIGIVVLWLAKRRGDAGLLAWRPDEPATRPALKRTR